MNDVDAVAFLLERRYGFLEYDMLEAYALDTEQSYVVRFGKSVATNECEEVSFVTARDAANFFVNKKKEMHL